MKRVNRILNRIWYRVLTFGLLLAGLSGFWSCGSESRQSPAHPPRYLYLIRLGEPLPAGKMEVVSAQLERFYGIPVRILAPAALPAAAYYAPRQRYRASDLLRYLHTIAVPAGEGPYKVLALTTEDIETKVSDERPHWGIMGLARQPGQEAVVSLFRLAGKDHRLSKVAVHEVGHMFGLPHCPGPVSDHCVMRDARGAGKNVDQTQLKLCETCTRRLSTRLSVTPGLVRR